MRIGKGWGGRLWFIYSCNYMFMCVSTSVDIGWSLEMGDIKFKVIIYSLLLLMIMIVKGPSIFYQCLRFDCSVARLPIVTFLISCFCVG